MENNTELLDYTKRRMIDCYKDYLRWKKEHELQNKILADELSGEEWKLVIPDSV